MASSILDDLGHEVTGIVSPVTICMVLTVLLVRLLNPEGATSPSAIAIAQTYYKEQASDPTSVKLEGALINALIFVVIVGIMTFVLFLLFKYGCENCIWGYLAFAAFQILFLILGVVAIQLIQKQPIPIDAFSLVFILWNFSVVGTATMFMWPAPTVMKQGYMIVIGIVMAFLFTGIPEWTIWILLIAMAIYDVVAVLMPNGPLKLLVELAIERDAQIPALVYEARGGGEGRWRGRNRQGSEGSNQGAVAQAPVATVLMAHAPDPSIRRDSLEEIELTDQSSSSQDTPTEQSSLSLGGLHHVQGGEDRHIQASGIGYIEADLEQGPSSSLRDGNVEDTEALDGEAAGPSTRPARARRRARDRQDGDIEANERDDEEDSVGLPDGIKLGLGDFIFYSVLVGRAAMYDWLTVIACYLAIIAGLGATLICLALFKAALPALPISITLGVVFYFCARWILEPVLLPMSMHLLYF